MNNSNIVYMYFLLDLGDVNIIANVITCMYNLRTCMLT